MPQIRGRRADKDPCNGELSDFQGPREEFLGYSLVYFFRKGGEGCDLQRLLFILADTRVRGIHTVFDSVYYVYCLLGTRISSGAGREKKKYAFENDLSPTRARSRTKWTSARQIRSGPRGRLKSNYDDRPRAKRPSSHPRANYLLRRSVFGKLYNFDYCCCYYYYETRVSIIKSTISPRGRYNHDDGNDNNYCNNPAAKQ